MCSPWSTRSSPTLPTTVMSAGGTTCTSPASMRAAPTPPARTQITRRRYRRGRRHRYAPPMARTEEDLLAELNADLREGVDWKQGAITYLREIVASGGPDEERFHLVKPFVGGPDYAPFWEI